MNDGDGSALSVEEFVQYCRTQAGLLSGSVETMGSDLDDVLDEVDDKLAEIRTYLEGGTDGVGGTATPPSTEGPDDREVDVETIEELQASVEEKQALAEAKQARMRAFQELAAAYTALAEELSADVDDGREALDRVVEFEADHDAPAYFEDRRTVLEAAAEPDDPDAR